LRELYFDTEDVEEEKEAAPESADSEPNKFNVA
jgi:hypothetical protein